MRSATPRAGRRAWLLRCVGACLALLAAFSAPTATAEPAPAPDVPRARLAADTQHIAATLEMAVSDAGGIIDAVAGTAVHQSLLVLLANVTAAIDAPAFADRAWARAGALARQRGDEAGLSVILAGNILTTLSLGDYERGTTLASELATLAQQRQDATGTAAAEKALGILARRRGKLDEALQHEQRALQLQKDIGNRAGITLVLGDLSVIYRDRGDFARALGTALDAIAQSEQDGYRLDNVYRNAALLYREIEDAPMARTYFNRALDAAAERGVPSAYATVVGSYASFLNDVGEFDGALRSAEEALAIDAALGDLPHQGLERLEIGRALLGLHRTDEAEQALERALTIGREIGQREIVARALLHLTEVAFARHDTLGARGRLDEAIAGLEMARLRPQLAQAYALREQLARAERDDADALRFAHKYAALREELIGTRASRLLAALETRHARAESEQRLALLGKDNELQAERLERQRLQRRLYVAAVVGLSILLLLLVWRYLAVRQLNHALELRNIEIERQRAALSDANTKLEQQADELYHAATTDWLTATANRRHLLEQLEQRFDESRDEGRELAMLLIDFDHFKQINDRRGHPFGDRVLAAGARTMRECLAEGDLLGRFGGEEFAAVVSDLDADAAMALAERIRARVAERLTLLAPDLQPIATVSIGVARLAELDASAGSAALVEAADRALYAAKHDGRNRVGRYAA